MTARTSAAHICDTTVGETLYRAPGDHSPHSGVKPAHTTAEFFAGMGLIRAGLERCGIETAFANDIDPIKAALYRENWGDSCLTLGDICTITGEMVPDVDLATSSFPCTDVSLAGDRAGLRGRESGLVFEFCRILKEMGSRAPQALIIENVPGFLSSDGGRDYADVIHRLESMGYFVTSIMIDAAAFVPQSRVRVFVLANKHRHVLVPDPPVRRTDHRLADIADHDADDWWVGDQRQAFLAAMSPLQSQRIDEYRRRPSIGWYGAYRRTRNGQTVWEVRGDEIAGALRTTRGGSSKQAIVRAGRGAVDVRWMSVHEYARLQGAHDLCYGSVSRSQAMFALGDAVCVPVIEWLGNNWLLRVLS